MNRHRRIFSLIACLITGSLFGGTALNDECWESGECFKNLKFEASFLYFLPTIDDTYFVIDDRTDSFIFPDGKLLNNDFDFQPGFRVGASYHVSPCGGELQACYTRLRATQTRTVAGPFLIPTMLPDFMISVFGNYSGTAHSDLDLLYQRFDALYCHPLWTNCYINFKGFAGLEFAYLRLHENYEYQATVAPTVFGFLDEKSKSWGIGPQIGFTLDYLICETACWCPSSLSLIATTSSSLLASRTYKKMLSDGDLVSITGTLLNLSTEHTWRVIPAFHARVGLNYTVYFSSCEACFELGYEFNSYIRGLTRFLLNGGSSDNIQSTYSNFDLQGLYATAAICF